jgi:hypothetical protein
VQHPVVSTVKGDYIYLMAKTTKNKSYSYWDEFSNNARIGDVISAGENSYASNLLYVCRLLEGQTLHDNFISYSVQGDWGTLVKFDFINYLQNSKGFVLYIRV